jgi:hypothetical protein
MNKVPIRDSGEDSSLRNGNHAWHWQPSLIPANANNFDNQVWQCFKFFIPIDHNATLVISMLSSRFTCFAIANFLIMLVMLKKSKIKHTIGCSMSLSNRMWVRHPQWLGGVSQCRWVQVMSSTDRCQFWAAQHRVSDECPNTESNRHWPQVAII